jgi:hypothetical protein
VRGEEFAHSRAIAKGSDLKSKSRIVRLVAAGTLAVCATVLSAVSANAVAGPPGGGGGTMLGLYSQPQCYYLGSSAVNSGRYSQFSCAFDHYEWGNTEIDQLWVA